MSGRGPQHGGRSGLGQRNEAAYCGAMRTNGEPCRKYALRGSTPPRCLHHLAPQTRAARARHRERAELDAYFADLQGVDADLLARPDDAL